MNELVKLIDNEPMTTSLIVSRELNRLHRNILDIINNYYDKFLILGKLERNGDFENDQRTGNTGIFYYLNEPQLTFLIMILRVKKNENDKVLDFKLKITQEFYRMKEKLYFGKSRIKRTPQLLLLEDNGVQSFITDCLLQSSSDTKSVLLYKYYIIYCDKNKYHPLGRNYFINAMRESNLTYYTKNGKSKKENNYFRGFKNIKLKDKILLEGDN